MEGTVKFIPVKHGSRVDTGNLGIFGVSGSHKYLGFKPAPGRKREGWLVVLVTDTGQKPKRKLAAEHRGRERAGRVVGR